MNSDLPKLLNFNEDNIDWYECDKISHKSLFMQVVDRWNNKKDSELVKDISEEFNIHRTTVLRYLIKANETGLCVYEGRSKKK